jgi:uncharacterized linocin/CFP29 family protein
MFALNILNALVKLFFFMYKSNKTDNKIRRSILVQFFDLFKIEKTTSIPSWIKERKESNISSKSNAASKVIKFAKEVNITQSKLLEIYQIECEYEEKKREALEQLPHLPQIMKKEISEFRSAKMDKMQEVLTKSQFDIYSKLFRKNKQHY